MNISHRARVLVATGLLLVMAAFSHAVAQTRPDGQTVEVSGMRMYYETAGQGDPLVLLHSGTQTVRMWDPFVDDLAARYRLIIPDLRGHGGSTNPGNEWSTRQFARDVFALLDHLGIERIRGVGASAGAMTLLHMATQQPERIESMVVVGVGTYLPADCRKILAGTDVDAYSQQVWDLLRAKHAHGDEQTRALFGWVASLADSYGDMTFTPPFLATITARTLVVHGDRDYCFPASMGWDIYQAIPDAYLWVVPNGSHVPIDGERAPQFTRTVLEFLGPDWR